MCLWLEKVAGTRGAPSGAGRARTRARKVRSDGTHAFTEAVGAACPAAQAYSGAGATDLDSRVGLRDLSPCASGEYGDSCPTQIVHTQILQTRGLHKEECLFTLPWPGSAGAQLRHLALSHHSVMEVSHSEPSPR